MIIHRAHFFLLLLYIFRSAQTPTAATPPYTPKDFILLSCGAPANSNDTSHRLWDSDARSRYAPSNADTTSSASKASVMDPSVSPVPFQTARFFRSSFTYTFPVSVGPKFLRLHFHPTAYSGFDTSQSFFSVKANDFTLLANFSASLYSANSSRASFVREFMINVQGSQRLALTFSPTSGAFAFVNGIEIVSIPDNLYFRGNDVALKTPDRVYYLADNTALEKLYRLNVGGAYVGVEADTGMFRDWFTDDDYVAFGDFGWMVRRDDVSVEYTQTLAAYAAPAIVYTSARMMTNLSISLEWRFPVDSGFNYLLRLHFCEFTLEVTKQNQRAFTIKVDNQTVEPVFDIIYAAGGPRIPIFMDYVIWVPDLNGRRKKDLRLSLIPYEKSHTMYLSALLNGLEMFKLSDAKRSLAAANPDPVFGPPPPAPHPVLTKKGGSSVIFPVIGGVVGALTAVAVVSFLILRRRRKVKDSATSDGKSSWMPLSIGSRNTARSGGSGVSLPSDLCRYFSIDEIKTATRDFDDNFIVGRGGFGNVYRGLIDSAATTVAIKRLNPSSSQGAREFLTEIEMLSKLRHHHLVSLIGYCDDDGEMILVYDYMAHGTLRDHLYNSQNSPLTWKQRLQICLGAAKGLDYLHTGAKNAIIHRDVKTTNILLDEKLVAKVSDFGLSKVGPAAGAQTHVSTVVKGSFGYVDPEYYRRQQLTLKSDVYSFGVVLFEVLCARPPIIPNLPREQVNLGEWAKFCFRKGTLDQIIDSNLDGQIAPECLSKFVETAVACLKDRGIDRPSMNDIVWSLEFATQLQASAESGGGDAAAAADGEGFVAVNASQPLLGIGASTTTEEETFSRSKSGEFSTSSSDRCKSGDAFSELMNPTGR